MNDHDQEETHFPPIKKPNQKFRVKIHKIEPQEEEHEEGDFGFGAQIRPQKNDGPRVCRVCKKGFSSGKALGGHVRVHVQANKEQKKKQNNDDNAHAAGNRAICSLCGKNFPSMKSLFGHMRCHPEREWRGIQPPTPAPAKNSSPAASSVSDYQIDLAESLRGCWPSTAKRGRKALVPDDDDPPLEEERVHEAVQYLMKLAQGDSFGSSLSPSYGNRVDDDHEGINGNLTEIEDKNFAVESRRRGRIEESLGGYNVGHEGINGNLTQVEDKNWAVESRKRGRIEESWGVYNDGYDHLPVKKLGIEELSGSPEGNKNLEKGKGKGIVLLGDIQDCEKFIEDDETESQNSDCSIPSGNLIVNYKCNGQFKSNKKKRKKLNLRDLGSPPGVDKPNPVYKCSTCDKCFPTHQALGGHRSSHNKVRSSNYIEHHEDNDIPVPNHPPATGVDENEEGGGSGAGGALKVVAENSIIHQCKICDRTFPTGQALGGHKRCHWMGPLEAPSSHAGSPGEASHTGRKIRGFDLNEIPAMEEEVESEHHAAAGYSNASSSYNSQ